VNRLQARLFLLTFITLVNARLFSQQFFPTGAFYPDNLRLDSLVSKWYSEQLAALREPSLFQAKDTSDQIYRFLWLRTFDHPVAVRVIFHSDGSATVTTKIADGTGGSKPGRLIVDKTESLSAEKAKTAVEKAHRLLFTAVPLRDPDTDGRDGAQWVIEGFEHGHYRLIQRWSPNDGPVRELGFYFLQDLSRLDLKREEIY